MCIFDLIPIDSVFIFPSYVLHVVIADRHMRIVYDLYELHITLITAALQGFNVLHFVSTLHLKRFNCIKLFNVLFVYPLKILLKNFNL